MSDTLAGQIHQLQSTGSTAFSSNSSTLHGDPQTFAWLQEVQDEDIRHVFDLVLETPVCQWMADPSSLAEIWVELVRRQQTQRFSSTDQQLCAIATIYGQLHDHSALRTLVLRFLVSAATASSLKLFAELVVSDPPRQPHLLLEIFGDLVRTGEQGVVAALPRLLDGLNQPELASIVLDFCNYAQRNHLTDEHAATSRSGQLIELLGGLADRLGQLQESSPTTQEEVANTGRQVTESVSLGISLCDTLALIGDREAVASLYKTMQVEHRRLRVEAAAALAKLGEEAGRHMLTALAAEPVERLRVLAYAEELGLLDQVADQFASPVARVEAEFVMHLAQPTQFGLAPHHVELVNQRQQRWPGFDEPQSCFLFQFGYQFPAGEYTNIGIAGPVVFSFTADLRVLSHDDVYALFAGWHVRHPDIFAIEPQRAVGQDQIELGRLHARLHRSGYEDCVPASLGNFLGRRVLIAAAQRDGESGWVMVSEDSYDWLSGGDPSRPLGALEAFCLFVGRALLASFERA